MSCFPLHARSFPKPAPCLLLGLALVAGCASTRIVDTWQAPGLEPADLAFEHVVAIAVLPDVTRRRIVEDALAAEAERTRVTPAYRILDRDDRGDPQRVRAALERSGIDGAVVVHVVDVEKTQTYVPGTTRMVPGGFYGYYGAVSRVGYDPGYVRTDTAVVVETSLYDVERGELLWTGISRTMNPSDLGSLVEGIAEAARNELREQGLLP